MKDFKVSMRVDTGDGTEIAVSVDVDGLGTLGNSLFVHQQFRSAAIKATDQIEKMLIAQYGKLKNPYEVS